ncbi:hypothetical protein GCK32_003219 [Trichostrongylus colubriformis]|uniref:Uncharacterized protein n=1 Tax=Trichostrongylus colubriformis TaxID=6319 RepID=A0AAN8FT23_TRICO
MFFFIFCALLLTSAFTAEALPCQDDKNFEHLCSEKVCSGQSEGIKNFKMYYCRKTCLIEAAFINKTRHKLGNFILLGYTFPQPEPKWTDNSPMDFKMFKGDFGTENIYCGPGHPKEGCGFLYMGNITGFANAWCYSWCGNLAVRNMRVFGVCTTA